MFCFSKTHIARVPTVSELFQDSAELQPTSPAFPIHLPLQEEKEREGRGEKESVPWASHYAYGKYVGLS